nr:RNA-directed DNA polymerase, eukaryota, reverse transcriptase zinc-binding domain protein [Tanacetum cinerariifolium]
MEFNTEGRIAWVEVEGISFKLCSDNTFKRIATKWGELLDINDQDEMCFYSKRLCIYTKSEMNIFEEFKVIFRGRDFWIHAKEAPGWVPDFMEENDDEEQNDNGGFNVHKSGSCGGDSDAEGVLETIFEESGQKENNLDEKHTNKQENHSGDPFSIYKLLKKKKDNVEKENNSEHSMKYPLGFTPKEGTDVVGMHTEESDNIVNMSDHNTKEVNNTFSGNCTKKNSKEDVSNSVCSGHFKTSMVPHTCGSILSLMDELVKVGQVMGYKMDGCMSNMTEITESQGGKEIENMELFSVKMCWGNFALDYVNSDSVGMEKKNVLSAKNVKAKYKDELEALEAISEKGDGNVEVVNKRMEGIMVDGMWIESPNRVKGEFFHHFSSRFDKLDARWAHIEMRYQKTLTCDQQVQVSKAIHGDDGKVRGYVKDGAKSCWLSIVNEINSLKNKGVNLLDFMHVKLGNGDKTAFWEDIWIEGKALKNRVPRGGVEQEQFEELSALVHDVTLTPMLDRWIWTLKSSRDFSVASVRKVIDDKSLLKVDSKTRWIRYVPIKVNVHAWKVKTDLLPTRFNVSHRAVLKTPHQNRDHEFDQHIIKSVNPKFVKHLIRSKEDSCARVRVSEGGGGVGTVEGGGGSGAESGVEKEVVVAACGGGASTTQSYSLGTLRNAECSNCKHLLDKITILEATVDMYMHPEQHILNSAALFHEVYNNMGKLDLE